MAHYKVTRNVFHYVEIETASLVEDRAEKGSAGDDRLETAARARARDGAKYGFVGGSYAIRIG